MMPTYPDEERPETSPPRQLRKDLAAVEIDGDLVVYDPREPACHVLSGGAVLVWLDLEGSTTEGLVERVQRRIGPSAADIEQEILEVVKDFDGLGFLTERTN